MNPTPTLKNFEKAVNAVQNPNFFIQDFCMIKYSNM